MDAGKVIETTVVDPDYPVKNSLNIYHPAVILANSILKQKMYHNFSANKNLIQISGMSGGFFHITMINQIWESLYLKTH